MRDTRPRSSCDEAEACVLIARGGGSLVASIYGEDRDLLARIIDRDSRRISVLVVAVGHRVSANEDLADLEQAVNHHLEKMGFTWN